MQLDSTNAIKVTDNIWWIGFADYEAGFSNNPYLLVDEDEAILFDPGPGHPIFRDIVMEKIGQVIRPEQVKYIVTHHQDPDICGLIPFIENLLHPDVTIIAHPRTAIFIPYYGVRKGFLPVGDGDSLELKSGRKIFFYHTPYIHFAGNIVSFDSTSKSLFSSDIFAVFEKDWSLQADQSYLELAKNFIEHYVGSKEALTYTYKKLKTLDIKRILPQHGGIIENDLDSFLNILKNAEPGQLLKDIDHKPSKEDLIILKKTGEEWLSYWLKKEVETASFTELMQYAIDEGPATVSLLIENISLKAKNLGVANPLTYGHNHKWDEIKSTKANKIIQTVRKNFLTKQYGMQYGDNSNFHQLIYQELNAFKAKLVIMFVDIRAFTKWSSNKPPTEVIRMLNKHHQLVTNIISKNYGRINKVMGDGLIIYFHEISIYKALESAFKIHEDLRNENKLPVGIGLDIGEVVMGDLGEEIRLDYTLIGQPVNYASRMCSAAAAGEIVITKTLYNTLKEAEKQKIFTNCIKDEFLVKYKPTDPSIPAIKLIPQYGKDDLAEAEEIE